MTVTGILCWTLLLVFGAPLLLTAVSLKLWNGCRQSLENIKDMDYEQIPFSSFPFYLRLLLGRYRKQALRSGFKELAIFHRPKLETPNFCVILVSPDGQTLCEIEYIRIGLLISLIHVAMNPTLISHVFGIYGFTLTTGFHPLRRLITTPCSFLARDHIEGEKEIKVVSSDTPFSEIFLRHTDEKNKLIEEQQLNPFSFSTPEEVFDFERKLLNRLAEVSLRELEANEGLTS